MAVKGKVYPVFKILALLLLVGDLVLKFVFKLNLDPVAELSGVLLVLIFLWALKSAGGGPSKTEFVQIEMGKTIRLSSGLEIIYEKLVNKEASFPLKKMGIKNWRLSASYQLPTNHEDNDSNQPELIIGLEKIFCGVFDEEKMPSGTYIKTHTANEKFAILKLITL